MSGCLTQARDFLLIPPTVTGYSPMMVGCGFLNIHGVGRLFTMAGGTPILITDRCGSLITTGARDG
jgi:hypothetical protein